MARLVENAEEKRPDVVVVGLHHVLCGRDERLAPCDPVGAHHKKQGALVSLDLSQLVRHVESLAKKLALAGERLASDALVGVDHEGIFLEVAAEHAKQGAPDQVAPMVVRQEDQIGTTAALRLMVLA